MPSPSLAGLVPRCLDVLSLTASGKTDAAYLPHPFRGFWFQLSHPNAALRPRPCPSVLASFERVDTSTGFFLGLLAATLGIFLSCFEFDWLPRSKRTAASGVVPPIPGRGRYGDVYLLRLFSSVFFSGEHGEKERRWFGWLHGLVWSWVLGSLDPPSWVLSCMSCLTDQGGGGGRKKGVVVVVDLLSFRGELGLDPNGYKKAVCVSLSNRRVIRCYSQDLCVSRVDNLHSFPS
ncbi:uncharacterized protein BDZ83DRAFT_133558 [Colletotrichum acutatum]|uniref:Uncharacterized protein n=1 Tax=Glomerella acutata TaxID=27357 RepID=A0AAD8XBQ1_GLOAC|nr:uncharacterized protein BDZ83DRAFT_133558 [Colletotrichum acutatum]KAK1710052.1 hypothetical protein BDZ83DRAFT_133558 [Colletotrichum acutatum]